MWEAIGVAVALLGAAASLYAARGGGPDERIMKQAKHELELVELLPEGAPRNELQRQAQRSVVRALKLRETREHRTRLLGSALCLYVLAATMGLVLLLRGTEELAQRGNPAVPWTMVGLVFAAACWPAVDYLRIRLSRTQTTWLSQELVDW